MPWPPVAQTDVYYRTMAPRYLLVLCLLVACRSNANTNAGQAGQVLATMDGMTFTVRDLQARAPRLARAIRDELGQATSDFQRRTLLMDKLLEEEALIVEAHRRGYDRSPAVVDAMVNRMLEDEVVAEDKAYAVPDADVARYYADHVKELGRPELVRVLQIVTPDRARAVQILAQARSFGASDLTAFQRLVEEHSTDPVSRLMGGDLGFFDASSTRYPGTVVVAAFALHDLFAVSDVVASPQGFHVLKLVQRLPAYAPSLAEATPAIRSRLRWLLIERKKYALGKKILGRAAPDVDLALLAKVPLPEGVAEVVSGPHEPAPGPNAGL